MSRTRTRRTYGRAPLKLSEINPADINMCPGTQIELSIVCRECYSWHRVVGETDRRVIQHGGHNGEHCPGGSRQVQVDITPAQWIARLRHQKLDALSPETRRAATQHYKPLPGVPGPVHLMATPRPEVQYTAAQRTEQWKQVLRAVKETDSHRAEIPADAIGPIRGIEAPTKVLRPGA